MKDRLISVLILIFTSLFVLGNAFYITHAIRETEDRVEKQTALSEEEQKRIYSDFQKKERWISLTVNHEDLMSAEANFSDWIGAAVAGSEEEFTITKSRLVDSLEHLRRLSGISPESIF